jgi:hypothetical protein
MAVAVAVLRTSMPRRVAAVRRPVVRVAVTRNTSAANESPAFAPGFLLVGSRFPARII